MICIKKFLYSAVFVFLFSVFTVFGISPNTNAASYSEDFSSTTTGTSSRNFDFYPTFVKISLHSAGGSYPTNSPTLVTIVRNGSNNSNSSFRCQVQFSLPAPGFTGPFDYYCSIPGNLNYFVFGVTSVNAGFSNYFDYVTFTFTDDMSFSSAVSGSLEITENGTFDVTNYAEAVVNVPTGGDPGSGGSNYHDDLVSINNSIIICAAVLLVLYFFYCIYRIFAKGLSI